MASPRLLHTSDWHLGATLGQIDRQPDHIIAIESLVDLATDVAPDLIVHTGDLFDSPRPGAPAQKLAVEAFRRLSEIAPIVLIAGNHDNGPMLHNVWQPLLDLDQATDRIHIRGLLSGPENGGVVIVPRRDGTGSFYVCCTPYISVHAFAQWAGGNLDDDGTDAPQSDRRQLSPPEVYSDGLARLARRYSYWLSRTMDPAHDIAVSAAHVLVSGAQPGGSERKVHEADDFAAAISQLPTVAYAAFGHIHRPQALPGGRVPGRYAGSLIPIDFGEGEETKSTVLVEFDAGGVANPRTIDHSVGRPFVLVTGTVDELAGQTERCAGAIVKVEVTTTEAMPGLAARVAAVLGPTATIFNIHEDRHGTLARRDAGRSTDASTLEGMLKSWLNSNRISAPDPTRSATIVEALVDGATNDTTVRFDADLLIDGVLLARDFGAGEDIITIHLGPSISSVISADANESATGGSADARPGPAEEMQE